MFSQSVVEWREGRGVGERDITHYIYFVASLFELMKIEMQKHLDTWIKRYVQIINFILSYY